MGGYLQHSLLTTFLLTQSQQIKWGLFSISLGKVIGLSQSILLLFSVCIYNTPYLQTQSQQIKWGLFSIHLGKVIGLSRFIFITFLSVYLQHSIHTFLCVKTK